MTKSRSDGGKKGSGGRRVPRPDFAMGRVTKRLRGSKIIYDARDDIALDLMGMYASKVTDVVDIVAGDEGGQTVRLRDVDDIPDNALRAIKKIKVTPGRFGDVVEVEMIDRVRLGQMLAKAAGLLDVEKEVDKPSVVSIEMVMPEEDKGDG